MKILEQEHRLLFVFGDEGQRAFRRARVFLAGRAILGIDQTARNRPDEQLARAFGHFPLPQHLVDQLARPILLAGNDGDDRVTGADIDAEIVDEFLGHAACLQCH